MQVKYEPKIKLHTNSRYTKSLLSSFRIMILFIVLNEERSNKNHWVLSHKKSWFSEWLLVLRRVVVLNSWTFHGVSWYAFLSLFYPKILSLLGLMMIFMNVQKQFEIYSGVLLTPPFVEMGGSGRGWLFSKGRTYVILDGSP